MLWKYIKKWTCEFYNDSSLDLLRALQLVSIMMLLTFFLPVVHNRMAAVLTLFNHNFSDGFKCTTFPIGLCFTAEPKGDLVLSWNVMEPLGCRALLGDMRH